MPRTRHRELHYSDRDPVAILEKQNVSRIQNLIPVRIGRMLESPFAFYRGTAAVMANDLADEARTGVFAVSCGDAHVANFGFFASPDRRLLFDLNDFDESAPAPWEWDVKRLAGSVMVGSRHNGFSEEQALEATRAAVWSYRTTIRELHEMSALERYYFRVEYEELEAAATGEGLDRLHKLNRRAHRKNSAEVLRQITVTDEDGVPKIVDQPPVLQHFTEMDRGEVEHVIERYVKTLRPDRNLVFSKFRMVDYALRVVGVGSVGTRCAIALMLGPSDAPLFLQFKEAQPSVLETWGRISPMPIRGLGDRDRRLEGYRVVSCQQVLQAASDPFLGWVRTRTGVDFYVRQFRDMKGSVNLDALPEDVFLRYGVLCGRLLARAHSQSPGSAAIAGYLGQSNVFDGAVAGWAKDYADRSERDFEALEHAVKTGRLQAERGV
jgi:uncharacterized protein (DUF2252 family)